MKRVLTFFFVTLGVIFFLILVAGGYFWITDPWGIKPLLSGSVSMPSIIPSPPDVSPSDDVRNTVVAEEVDKNPLLSDTQEKTLETFGIDPASLPSSITPQQEACFVQILGEARVAEIKAGSSPTPGDFFSARSCI